MNTPSRTSITLRRTMVVLSALFVLPVTGNAAADTTTVERTACAGCEPVVAGVSRTASAPIVRDELRNALHEARHAGDELTMRQIEQQLQDRRAFPVGESLGQVVIRPTENSNDVFVWHRPGSVSTLAAGRTPGTEFGTDVRISHTVLGPAVSPSVAADSEGNLYVAYQGTNTENSYLSLFYSDNDGGDWEFLFTYSRLGSDILEPSIAIAEGNEDKLLVAYIVDNGVDVPEPYVLTASLEDYVPILRPVPHFANWEDYRRPVVWTDSVEFNNWYAYVAFEGVYDEANGNVNVVFARSTDFGLGWSDPSVLFGNFDAYWYRDPNGSFGTTQERVFVSTYDDSNDTLYSIASDDFGASFNEPVVINVFPSTFAAEPVDFPVDPQIEAAVDNDNVMFVLVKRSGDYDVIGYTSSTDAGQTWPDPLWSLPGISQSGVQPVLCANPGGGSWHLAFGDAGRLFYSRRPQDLSDFWQSSTDRVDDAGAVSSSRSWSTKGIAAHWQTDGARIVWASFRQGSPHTDIYFDGECDDADSDGQCSRVDNCTLVSNADQRDTNDDGIGNICDPDLDNDCIVNFADLSLFEDAFFTDDADADLDGSGVVNFGDLNIVKAMFFGPPGPSGALNDCDDS